MSTVYEWVIETIAAAKVEGDLTDVAKTVHWRMNATDGEDTATAYGTVELDPASADGFVAFDSLTRDQVIAWVTAKLDMSEADIQAALAQRIADDRDPPVVQKLPAGW